MAWRTPLRVSHRFKRQGFKRQGVSFVIRLRLRSSLKQTLAASSRKLESICGSALGRVIPALWHDMLRVCSAVEVFDFFHSAGLATHSYRHHCLAALRRESFPQLAHRVHHSTQVNLDPRT